jgi:hypothetical protein
MPDNPRGPEGVLRDRGGRMMTIDTREQVGQWTETTLKVSERIVFILVAVLISALIGAGLAVIT